MDLVLPTLIIWEKKHSNVSFYVEQTLLTSNDIPIGILYRIFISS